MIWLSKMTWFLNVLLSITLDLCTVLTVLFYVKWDWNYLVSGKSGTGGWFVHQQVIWNWPRVLLHWYGSLSWYVLSKNAFLWQVQFVASKKLHNFQCWYYWRSRICIRLGDHSYWLTVPDAEVGPRLAFESKHGWLGLELLCLCLISF